MMCFERLERDLDTALLAIDDGNHELTNSNLRHAQDLLSEMASMVDVDAWEHAPALLSVYDYLLRRLAHANMFKDAAGVVESRRLVGELGDSFRAAAAEVAATPAAPPPRPAGFVDDAADRPRLSVRA